MDARFRLTLVTKGRKTGRCHAVALLAVRYGDKIYVSRHRPDSDWFLNALADPAVHLEWDRTSRAGTASVVTDAALAGKISQLKYPGQQRAHQKRVVMEVDVDGGLQ